MRDYLLVPSVSESVELDEQFDYVLLDKDNKMMDDIVVTAKKDTESGKKGLLHLPPMRIPKNEVGKMKIVPISPKKVLETWF